MSNYPYPEPHTFGAPRRVVITDAEAFQMPCKCVVCGSDEVSLLTYTQDHVPLIGPGIGLVRTTPVSLPYCAEHARAFRGRFRNLRVAQGVAGALLIAGWIVGCSKSFRAVLGWDPGPGLGDAMFCGSVFLFLAATVFLIKPFLYDAYFKRFGNRLAIKSHSEIFIKDVIEANRQIARSPSVQCVH